MPILTYFHYNHHLPLLHLRVAAAASSTSFASLFRSFLLHLACRCLRPDQLDDRIAKMPKAEHRNSPEQEPAAASGRRRRGKKPRGRTGAGARGSRDAPEEQPPPPAADAAERRRLKREPAAAEVAPDDEEFFVDTMPMPPRGDALKRMIAFRAQTRHPLDDWDAPLQTNEISKERHDKLLKGAWSKVHSQIVEDAMQFAIDDDDISAVHNSWWSKQLTPRVFRYASHARYFVRKSAAAAASGDDFLARDAIDAAASDDAKEETTEEAKKEAKKKAKEEPGKKAALLQRRAKSAPKAPSFMRPQCKLVSRPGASASASSAGAHGKSAARRFRRRLTSCALRLTSTGGRRYEEGRSPQPAPFTAFGRGHRSRQQAADAARAAVLAPIDRPSAGTKRSRPRRHDGRVPEDPADVDEDALLRRPGYPAPQLQRFLARRIVHDSHALRHMTSKVVKDELRDSMDRDRRR